MGHQALCWGPGLAAATPAPSKLSPAVPVPPCQRPVSPVTRREPARPLDPMPCSDGSLGAGQDGDPMPSAPGSAGWWKRQLRAAGCGVWGAEDSVCPKKPSSCSVFLNP